MPQAARQQFTVPEYVLLEEMSTVKHEGDGWTRTGLGESATVEVKSLGLTPAVDEIYFDPLAS